MNRIFYVTFLIFLTLTSCAKRELKPPFSSLGRSPEAAASMVVTSVSVVNNQLIINGSGLSSVTAVGMKNSSLTFDESFAIESKTNSQIIANGLKGVSLVANKIFDLILSNAQASATFPISISLCETCDIAPDKSVLTYNQSTGKWAPANINGLNYKGTHDASLTMDPILASPHSGDYYVISIHGVISGVTYNPGDWIVYNEDTLSWERIQISANTIIIDKTTEQALKSVRLYGANTTNYVEITAPTLAATTTYKWPASHGTNGQVLTTNTTGDLSWTTLAPATSGITSLGGLSGASQSFDVVTSGVSPDINSSGSTHTLNIPMASTTAATAGLISKTDYDNFSNKQSALVNSAGLMTAISDETGTGSVVFSASPVFTGTPVAPTAAADTNTTQIATTAFVLGQAGTATPAMDGTGVVGTSTRYARQDHVHPVDTSRAPAAGSTSVSTLGTVTTGTWNGSTVSIPYGGTGATTAAAARTNLGLVKGSLDTNIPVLGANAVAGSMCTFDVVLGFICTQPIPTTNNVVTSEFALGTFSVRVATTANITLSGIQTIDGVTILVGTRVLVKNQTIASANGIYIAATGAWSRAADMDTWDETIGYHVHVGEGIAGEAMTYITSSPASGVLGTTNIYWIATGSTSGVNKNNTASGIRALNSNTTGDRTTAVGPLALMANTTGNSNQAFGYKALAANTTGTSNVAVGDSALAANQTSSYNVAVGDGALYVSLGAQNVAVGASALAMNTTANFNTAVGYNALNANTTANSNVALGAYALGANSTGGPNIGLGSFALNSNTIGGDNTAVGYQALYSNISGSYNTSSGRESLYSNKASNNTAYGYNALFANTTGVQNLGIGYNSGNSITTGSYNVVLGSNSGTTIATLSNNVIISDGQGNIRMQANSTGDVGIGGAPSTSYKLQVTGDFNATGIVKSNGSTLTSDRRLKKDIKVIPDALEKLFSISGVSYNWDNSNFPELNLGHKPQLGVIAQEVEKVFPEAVARDDKGIRSVAYNMLIAPIIESIKAIYHKWFDDSVLLHREIAAVKNEANERISKLEAQNKKLQEENEEIKARFNKIEKLLLKK